MFIGVALDGPFGFNDGCTADGTRYFQCAPKHGLFVRPMYARSVLVDIAWMISCCHCAAGFDTILAFACPGGFGYSDLLRLRMEKGPQRPQKMPLVHTGKGQVVLTVRHQNNK